LSVPPIDKTGKGILSAIECNFYNNKEAVVSGLRFELCGHRRPFAGALADAESGQPGAFNRPRKALTQEARLELD
jgi:hypothetical protein